MRWLTIWLANGVMVMWLSIENITVFNSLSAFITFIGVKIAATPAFQWRMLNA